MDVNSNLNASDASATVWMNKNPVGTNRQIAHRTDGAPPTVTPPVQRVMWRHQKNKILHQTLLMTIAVLFYPGAKLFHLLTVIRMILFDQSMICIVYSSTHLVQVLKLVLMILHAYHPPIQP